MVFAWPRPGKPTTKACSRSTACAPRGSASRCSARSRPATTPPRSRSTPCSSTPASASASPPFTARSGAWPRAASSTRSAPPRESVLPPVWRGPPPPSRLLGLPSGRRARRLRARPLARRSRRAARLRARGAHGRGHRPLPQLPGLEGLALPRVVDCARDSLAPHGRVTTPPGDEVHRQP